MNNAKKSKQNGWSDGSGRGTPPLSRDPHSPSSPLSMRDLGLKHLEYKANPDAKRLADFYAPQIIEMLRRGKNAQVGADSRDLRSETEIGMARKEDKAANGYMPESELTEEDLAALEELPL